RLSVTTCVVKVGPEFQSPDVRSSATSNQYARSDGAGRGRLKVKATCPFVDESESGDGLAMSGLEANAYSSRLTRPSLSGSAPSAALPELSAVPKNVCRHVARGASTSDTGNVTTG